MASGAQSSDVFGLRLCEAAGCAFHIFGVPILPLYKVRAFFCLWNSAAGFSVFAKMQGTTRVVLHELHKGFTRDMQGVSGFRALGALAPGGDKLAQNFESFPLSQENPNIPCSSFHFLFHYP